MTQKLHPLKLLVLLSWIIAISLYSVTPTFAKDRPSVKPTTKSRLETSRSLTVNSQKVRFIDVKLFSPDGKELTNLSPEVRKKLNAAVAKSLCNGDYGMLQDGFGSCFGNCLKSFGVSPIQLVLCGTSCALWETGVGLIICAVCVGLDVTAVTFCAVGCGAYGT